MYRLIGFVIRMFVDRCGVSKRVCGILDFLFSFLGLAVGTGCHLRGFQDPI